MSACKSPSLHTSNSASCVCLFRNEQGRLRRNRPPDLRNFPNSLDCSRPGLHRHGPRLHHQRHAKQENARLRTQNRRQHQAHQPQDTRRTQIGPQRVPSDESEESVQGQICVRPEQVQQEPELSGPDHVEE